jgi:hypothetical protein
LKQARTPGQSFSQQYLRESARGKWVSRSLGTLAAALLIAGGCWFFYHAKASGQFVALVRAMSGNAEITRGTQRIKVEVGTLVLDQDTVSVAPGASSEIGYARDDTAVTLLSDATATLSANSDALQVWLKAGALASEVAPQPAGRPMRFITPQAIAEAPAAKLNLAISNASTRLEVNEGSVRLTGNDRASVTVNAGEYAVATQGAEIKVHSMNKTP